MSDTLTTPSSANHVVHFAIHADDVERAKVFYEEVFGWSFEAWGPPDFYLVHTGPEEDRGIHGALQKRQVPLVPGQGVATYECTIGVTAVAETAKAVVEHGGEIVVPETEIPTVGTLVQFKDCLLYTSPSPRDATLSRMPSSA